MKKHSQISVVEFSLILLLLSGILGYLLIPTTLESNSYSYTNVNTYLFSLTKNSNFRELVNSENLSNSNPTENWGPIHQIINKTYKKYEIKLSNSTHSKKIISCNSKNSKIQSQQTISIYSNTNFNPKIITFGVCN